jgi:uncharacterized membrane protein YhaH (DUF805 family)
MEGVAMALRRSADFNGRSQRMEYWMFQLALFLLYLLIAVLAVPFVRLSGGDGWAAAYSLRALVQIVLLIPLVAIQVRRFHDQDRSGWFVLLNLIPFVGGLIVLLFMCLEGTRGANRFGPVPAA